MKEKINKIERLKQALRPIDYYEKLPHLDAASLSEADRFYLKNFGIYNNKLSPENFVLRIRITGGRLNADAFTKIASFAHARNARVLLTMRAQIEVHDLTFGQTLELSRMVNAYGLTSWQTFTDNFRNIVTNPGDGLDETNEMEVFDLIVAMEKIFLKSPDYVGMIPRKFNVAISGSREQSTSFFGNDLYFAPANKDGKFGFNLYIGGKNSEIAKPLDIFADPSEVPHFFKAVADTYRLEGPRGSRSKVRFFHMIESIGLEEVRRRIVERIGYEPTRAGELCILKANVKDAVPMRQGGYLVRYGTRFGELTFPQADELVQLCQTYGIETLRLGVDQNIYLPGVEKDRPFQHAFSEGKGVLACAGSRYCVYSLTDTKSDAISIDLQRVRKLGITIGMSGCLKGCARHAFSDIGLVGIRMKLYHEVERGVRLYLGAEYTWGKRAGRLILYAVPKRRLNDMIDLIAALFEASGYDDFETFAAKVLNKYSEPALAFWLLYNLHRHSLKKDGLMRLDPFSPSDEKAYFIDKLPADSVKMKELLHGEEAFPFREAIVFLERALFSVKSHS